MRYNTFSLALGAYVNYRPFRNKQNALKGIVIAPSVRFWPKLSSTLAGDELRYANKVTGQEETHKVLEVGVNNTPLIINISVGYTFEIKRN